MGEPVLRAAAHRSRLPIVNQDGRDAKRPGRLVVKVTRAPPAPGADRPSCYHAGIMSVEILTAVAAVIGALMGLIGAATGLWNSYLLTKLTSRVDTNERLLNAHSLHN